MLRNQTLINWLNAQTVLNNLKTKVDDLEVDKLKTVPINLKKLSDVVSKEVEKNTKLNMLKSKSKLIRQKNFRCNYFNSHKSIRKRKNKIQIKKIEDDDYIIPDASEVGSKIPDASSLMTTSYHNTKFGEVENKIFNHNAYITA